YRFQFRGMGARAGVLLGCAFHNLYDVAVNDSANTIQIGAALPLHFFRISLAPNSHAYASAAITTMAARTRASSCQCVATTFKNVDLQALNVVCQKCRQPRRISSSENYTLRRIVMISRSKSDSPEKISSG